MLTKINLKVQSTMGPQGADRFLTSFYNSVILTLRLGTRIGLYGFLAMADVRPAWNEDRYLKNETKNVNTRWNHFKA